LAYYDIAYLQLLLAVAVCHMFLVDRT